MRTLIIQKNLDEIFKKHCDKVDEMFNLLHSNEDSSLKNMVFDLKKTNSNLLIHFCQFNDLIDIQNENFCQ